VTGRGGKRLFLPTKYQEDPEDLNDTMAKPEWAGDSGAQAFFARGVKLCRSGGNRSEKIDSLAETEH
jgi:hypothetical protein